MRRTLIFLPETTVPCGEIPGGPGRIVTKQGWAIVVATEGIRNPDGSLVYELSDASHLDPLKRPMTGGVGQFMANMVGES